MTGREFGGKAIYSCPIGQNVIGVIFQSIDKVFKSGFICKYSFCSMLLQLATRLCRNGIWTGTQPICSKNSTATHFFLVDFATISKQFF